MRLVTLARSKPTPVKRRTPVLFVEKQGAAEVMYQSFASVDQDVPAIAADIRKGPTSLYLEVDDLEAGKAAIAGMDVYMPEHTTFYGSREIAGKDPAGRFLTFAHFEKQP